MQRLPAADKEWRARPRHHRRRQCQRDPVRPDRRMHQPEMAAHLEPEYRERQHQCDPEPARHVGEFGVRRIVERGLLGLQRHAADRTAARTDLPYLGMHRARIDGAGRRRRLWHVSARGIFPALLQIARGNARRRRNNPALDGRSGVWRWRARRVMPQTGSIASRSRLAVLAAAAGVVASRDAGRPDRARAVRVIESAPSNSPGPLNKIP